MTDSAGAFTGNTFQVHLITLKRETKQTFGTVFTSQTCSVFERPLAHK